MTLLKACISRDGEKEGRETYKQIIEDCKDALDEDRCSDIEEILYDEGFEPDYVMDVINALC